jgi:hypothetical protein
MDSSIQLCDEPGPPPPNRGGSNPRWLRDILLRRLDSCHSSLSNGTRKTGQGDTLMALSHRKARNVSLPVEARSARPILMDSSVFI